MVSGIFICLGVRCPVLFKGQTKESASIIIERHGAANVTLFSDFIINGSCIRDEYNSSRNRPG